MPKVKIKEGTLELDSEILVVRHTAGFFENVFSRLVNLWKRKEDSIHLNEISLVVYERGIEGKMCPHILIYYGNRSRLIEFCEDGKEELQKVLDFLEKKGVELGVAVEG